MLTARARVLAAALLAGAALAASAASADAASSANLIVNGGPQYGVLSQSGYEDMTNPGWTITSGAPNETSYVNTGGFPDSRTPGAQLRGVFFTGGTHGNAALTQPADVAAAASAIDAGSATYDLSGWLGGWRSQDDAARPRATFHGPSGGRLR